MAGTNRRSITISKRANDVYDTVFENNYKTCRFIATLAEKAAEAIDNGESKVTVTITFQVADFQ